MMRRQRQLALLVTAALAAGAAPALANTTTVRDDTRESKQLKRKGRLDIKKAQAGHKGELLKHTVVMRKRVDADRGKERPLIAINTRGGRTTDPEYLVFGKAIFRQKKKGDPVEIGDAALKARGKRWIYTFDPAVIPGLKRYGWAAISTKGKAFDIAPSNRYQLHRP